MIVRKFEPEDFASIKEWGAQWGADYQEDQFPAIGFIVDGVAAYFLYATDSSVCWLENLIAKRGVDHETRDKAIDLLINELLDEAKAQGFSVAYATTGIVSVAKRAREYGCAIKVNQFFITKDLTNAVHLQ